jgi:hypothetical protein
LINQLYHEKETSTSAQELLRAALAYAKRGTPVFPCRPDKSPLTQHGFKDATTDPARIHAYWTRWPGANIGIPTGKASGLLVLDEDRTGALSELPGELPATTTARTGGGGLHMLYRYPAGEVIRNSASKLGAGIDVRGEGGYVIAPPSRTTGPYEWIERLPPADPPAWLLEALRKPPGKPERSKGERGPTPILAAGEKIPYRRRNDALASIAGRLHDGTRNLEQLTADLLGINASRCVPPLPEGEVEKIAGSIFKREPAKPSRDVTPEVIEKLDGIEAYSLWGRTWKGQGWKTPRSVMVALITEAHKHGQTTKDGVRVSISVRMLALASGVRKQALTRSNGALDKLKAAGIIQSVEHSGSKSGAFILIQPGRARWTHSSTDAAAPFSGSTLRAPLAAPSSGNSQPHPPTASRLRYSKPVYETVDRVSVRVGTVLRLGKSAEAVLDTLERVGEWMPVEDLADELGLKRSRDLRRRALKRLEEASVVEWSGDSVRLRLDWSAALNLKRKDDQEIDDHERDRKKYAEESRVYALKLEARKLQRVCGLEDIASRLEIGTEDVRRLLNIERPAEPEPAPVEPDGFIEDLERVEDPKTEPDTLPTAKIEVVEEPVAVEEPIHELGCECGDCLMPEPRYARLWRSPRVVAA